MRPLVGWSACADNGPNLESEGMWTRVGAKKKKPTKQETTIVNCKFCTCVCVCVLSTSAWKCWLRSSFFAFVILLLAAVGWRAHKRKWRFEERRKSKKQSQQGKVVLSLSFSPHYLLRLLLSLIMPKGSHSSNNKFFFSRSCHSAESKSVEPSRAAHSRFSRLLTFHSCTVASVVTAAIYGREFFLFLLLLLLLLLHYFCFSFSHSNNPRRKDKEELLFSGLFTLLYTFSLSFFLLASA